MCTAVLIGRNPPTPRICAHVRGLCWSAKIDDISLWSPDLNTGLCVGPVYDHGPFHQLNLENKSIAHHES